MKSTSETITCTAAVAAVVPVRDTLAGPFDGHTPGPWQIARPDSERCRVIIETAARGNDIPEQGCDLAVAYWGTTIEEANARLMASAPDLLADNARLRAALADMCDWFQAEPDNGALSASEHLLPGCPHDLAASLDKARAALAGKGGAGF